MKIVIIISTNDAETAWNALRFANVSTVYDNEVTVFLLGKGVEALSASTLTYDIQEQYDLYLESDSVMIGCGVCCDTRADEMPNLKESLKCDTGSMQQLYSLVAEADKVLTF